MEKIEEKKQLILKMANIQNKFEQKVLVIGGNQIKTQEQLARIYKNFIEKEEK